MHPICNAQCITINDCGNSGDGGDVVKLYKFYLIELLIYKNVKN